jgi:hypothetical protein
MGCKHIVKYAILLQLVVILILKRLEENLPEIIKNCDPFVILPANNSFPNRLFFYVKHLEFTCFLPHFNPYSSYNLSTDRCSSHLPNATNDFFKVKRCKLRVTDSCVGSLSFPASAMLQSHT